MTWTRGEVDTPMVATGHIIPNLQFKIIDKQIHKQPKEDLGLHRRISVELPPECEDFVRKTCLCL